MAYVPNWPGNICDNWSNHVHSIQGGRGMHTLGILLWMVAWSVVTFAIDDKARVWLLQRRDGLWQASLLSW